MTRANGRNVTGRELNDKLEIVRQEQKSEHWKTRLLVAVLSFPAAAKSLPALLGFFHWHI